MIQDRVKVTPTDTIEEDLMNNVHPIHLLSKRHQTELDEQRLEQACDWISRIDRGLQPEEHQALQQWLAENAQHHEVLLEVAKLWDKMDALSRLSDLFPATEKTKSSNTIKHWALAASVATLCMLGALLYRTQVLPQQDLVQQTAATSLHATYQTKIGENNTIELPDRSKLVLNTNSFVTVRYSEKTRIIELLRGEINIDVAHDKSRPLSVIAGGKVIQAVGTAFNVDIHKDYVELIVTDGKVLVGAQPKAMDDAAEQLLAKPLPVSSLAISKGERVDLDPKGKTTEQVRKIDQGDIAASLSWRSGNLIFRGETLQEALVEISRYTNIQFELGDDEKMKQLPVAGMFKTGDVDGLLEVFKNNFNVSHERLGPDRIRLKYAG
jgi:transmembrane sensor